MNSNWKNFLLSAQAHFLTPTDVAFPLAGTSARQRICPLVFLGVLSIGGKDAAGLLQGQTTCNINDLSETQSSLGALCNPKGRAIATFLLIKQADVFHLIVPAELLDTVRKRLGLFILRSDATITDTTNDYCLLGVSPSTAPTAAWLATTPIPVASVNFGDRSLVLATPDAAASFWSAKIQQGFLPENTDQWRLRDIVSGIPWLTGATSEAFVPLMLNLDKLGGISFSKGCYTGQEVIARTYYLGKSKRGLFLAESSADAPEHYTNVLDGRDKPMGHVLVAQADGQRCKMLVVIQIAEDNNDQLKLADGRPLVLLEFSTPTIA
ncbi:MAG: folate-binding protein [Methylovulum sp.]|uniref:CAF17-like 4Fe-4S cluster assembly/insertion protein YgfZ n=1 Tax=Methylovulum sp. TaxID=1916980 RepID=UPI0026193F70|nr:folate-binding protein [Methylovulum sp.]MDD2722716.1 folate-binding protein [Methylovulum sp.]